MTNKTSRNCPLTGKTGATAPTSDTKHGIKLKLQNIGETATRTQLQENQPHL